MTPPESTQPARIKLQYNTAPARHYEVLFLLSYFEVSL